MSEELQWELYDIFASGIFAFPVYEHSSARRIVRYLLMRGVPDEDVASAIEGHTVDLKGWLSRTGKRMVGEWVIAWLNETQEDYKYERRDRLRATAGKIKDGDQSEFTPKKRKQHRIRGNLPIMLDCSDDDDDFSDGDSDISSAEMSSFEGSVTSLSSINSSGVSCKNKPNSANSVSNLQSLSNTQSCIARDSTGDVKNLGRLTQSKTEPVQTDSACWLNTDTNSELDGCLEENNGLNERKSIQDIVNLVEGAREAPAGMDSRCSVISTTRSVNEENIEPPNSPSDHRSVSSCRFSSSFFGFFPHNTSSSEFSGGTTAGMKKRPHSAQTPATRNTSTECHCSINDSASSLLSRLSTANSELSTNVLYNARSWYQRSPGESPQSLPAERSSSTERSMTKQCRCTLPHYSRKNFRNILLCDRPSRCLLCCNSRPLEELQAVPVANGTKRRKGSAGMFRKISWIS